MPKKSQKNFGGKKNDGLGLSDIKMYQKAIVIKILLMQSYK